MRLCRSRRGQGWLAASTCPRTASGQLRIILVVVLALHGVGPTGRVLGHAHLASPSATVQHAILPETVQGVQQARGTFCMNCMALVLSQVYSLRSHPPCDTVLSALGFPYEAAYVSSSEVVHLHPLTGGQTQSHSVQEPRQTPQMALGLPGCSRMVAEVHTPSESAVAWGRCMRHARCMWHILRVRVVAR